MKKYAADKVLLIYVDEDGVEYVQPASLVVRQGTLTDPVTGDDMEVAYVVVLEE